MTWQPERCCFVGSTPTNLRVRESLRCPPSRRVPDKWSGRRPNKNTGRGSCLPVRNAEGCLSSEGGHRRLCAARPRRPRNSAKSQKRAGIEPALFLARDATDRRAEDAELLFDILVAAVDVIHAVDRGVAFGNQASE